MTHRYPDVAGSLRELLSPVLSDTGGGQLAYMCPGCGHVHVIDTRASAGPGHVWSWDGDAARPTFRPSVHWQAGNPKVTMCHHWVTAGRIAYLADSRHALAGKTVDMVELDPDLWGDRS